MMSRATSFVLLPPPCVFPAHCFNTIHGPVLHGDALAVHVSNGFVNAHSCVCWGCSLVLHNWLYAWVRETAGMHGKAAAVDMDSQKTSQEYTVSWAEYLCLQSTSHQLCMWRPLGSSCALGNELRPAANLSRPAACQWHACGVRDASRTVTSLGIKCWCFVVACLQWHAVGWCTHWSCTDADAKGTCSEPCQIAS